jgi:hypothetical protein
VSGVVGGGEVWGLTKVITSLASIRMGISR